MQAIELNKVVCQRRGEALFAPLSLTIERGELAVVAGPNGSGKTTLLECLAGLAPFASGQCLYQQQNLSSEWARVSHYIGHKLANKAALTCLENLQFALTIHGHTVTEQQLLDTLDAVGLAGYEYQLASELSAGQKKRLSLSRLLVIDAPFWLLDEPFVNLDHAGCQWLYQVLSEHIAQGGAVILTAHDQEKIHQMADHHIELEPLS